MPIMKKFNLYVQAQRSKVWGRSRVFQNTPEEIADMLEKTCLGPTVPPQMAMEMKTISTQTPTMLPNYKMPTTEMVNNTVIGPTSHSMNPSDYLEMTNQALKELYRSTMIKLYVFLMRFSGADGVYHAFPEQFQRQQISAMEVSGTRPPWLTSKRIFNEEFSKTQMLQDILEAELIKRGFILPEEPLVSTLQLSSIPASAVENSPPLSIPVMAVLESAGGHVPSVGTTLPVSSETRVIVSGGRVARPTRLPVENGSRAPTTTSLESCEPYEQSVLRRITFNRTDLDKDLLEELNEPGSLKRKRGLEEADEHPAMKYPLLLDTSPVYETAGTSAVVDVAHGCVPKKDQSTSGPLIGKGKQLRLDRRQEGFRRHCNGQNGNAVVGILPEDKGRPPGEGDDLLRIGIEAKVAIPCDADLHKNSKYMVVSRELVSHLKLKAFFEAPSVQLAKRLARNAETFISDKAPGMTEHEKMQIIQLAVFAAMQPSYEERLGAEFLANPAVAYDLHRKHEIALGVMRRTMWSHWLKRLFVPPPVTILAPKI